MSPLRLQRLGYALGAEIRGIDLRGSLDDETIARIREAWLSNLVLCFPGQQLEKEQFLAFVRCFGDELDDNRNELARDPALPNLLYLTNQPVGGRPWDGYKPGQTWHSDRSYTTQPASGTFLLAKMLPEVGGDTIFANQYLAYETLSPALRKILDGMSAVHDTRMIKNLGLRAVSEDNFRRNPPVVHPVIRVHPETGRKALYLGDRVRQFAGMTEEESRPLLDFLNRHAVRYELTYRHRWSPHDLVMWDNRALMHVAPSDYERSQPRHMWRASLFGPVTGRMYETAPGA